MPSKNLTGVPIQPSIWSDLGLGEGAFSEEEMLRRKKKMMAAGRSDDYQSATQILLGDRYSKTSTMGA